MMDERGMSPDYADVQMNANIELICYVDGESAR